jgi:hypothetical protein
MVLLYILRLDVQSLDMLSTLVMVTVSVLILALMDILIPTLAWPGLMENGALQTLTETLHKLLLSQVRTKNSLASIYRLIYNRAQLYATLRVESLSVSVLYGPGVYVLMQNLLSMTLGLLEISVLHLMEWNKVVLLCDRKIAV